MLVAKDSVEHGEEGRLPSADAFGGLQVQHPNSDFELGEIVQWLFDFLEELFDCIK